MMKPAPSTKGQRLTDSSGNVVARVELDTWGGDTNSSWNSSSQPHKYTTYERDANQSDEAMFRRYNRWWSRFDQPDPYDGSYDLTNPQSLNRYAYVNNDPVNFVDPTGLDPCPTGTVAQPDALGVMQCVGTGVSGVTVNVGGGQRSGGAGGASSGPIELETPTSPTEAEVVPLNPISPELNDCLTFADMVDDIANDLYLALASPWSGGQQAFMNRLATTFT